MDPTHIIGFEGRKLADALAHRSAFRARRSQGQCGIPCSSSSPAAIRIALNGSRSLFTQKESVCRLTRITMPVRAPERCAPRIRPPRTLDEVRGRPIAPCPARSRSESSRAAAPLVRTPRRAQNEIYTDLTIGRTDAVLLDATSPATTRDTIRAARRRRQLREIATPSRPAARKPAHRGAEHRARHLARDGNHATRSSDRTFPQVFAEPLSLWISPAILHLTRPRFPFLDSYHAGGSASSFFPFRFLTSSVFSYTPQAPLP